MGLSFTHLLLILVICLLIFGPQRLEGIGSSLGKAIKGFKKGLEEEENSSTTTTKSTSTDKPSDKT